MLNNSRKWITCFVLISISLSQFCYAQSASGSFSPQNIYKKVSGSIYTLFGIETDGEKGIALGSAVAIDGHILATNCHVALSGNMLFIRIGNQPKPASIIYHNDKDDFCLIEVSGDVKFTAVKIRASNDVQVGEDVVAIGNPEGYDKTISKGIVSNKYNKNNRPSLPLPNSAIMNHIIDSDNLSILQTDAPISHGSSGGGLFDKNGNLIGITTSGNTEGTNIGFAIPTELILVITTPNKSAGNSSAQPLKQPTVDQQSIASNPSEISSTSDNNQAIHLNNYGKSKIALIKWRDTCFIAITGRYNEDKPRSLAIYFPENPSGLFIFSKVINIENVIKFFTWINENRNIKYVKSKSFLYFNKVLYPLVLVSIDNTNQPVYIFPKKTDVTEDLITLDYFIGQFYGYDQPNDMTSIKFDLDGFTEALNGYNSLCKHSPKYG